MTRTFRFECVVAALMVVVLCPMAYAAELPGTGVSGVYEVMIGTDDAEFLVRYFNEFGFTRTPGRRSIRTGSGSIYGGCRRGAGSHQEPVTDWIEPHLYFVFVPVPVPIPGAHHPGTGTGTGLTGEGRC
jgi:hypothetical protein